MGRLTEYPRVRQFNDGDILIADGPNGTNGILVTDALADMYRNKSDIAKINGKIMSILADDANDIAGSSDAKVDLNTYRTPGSYKVTSSERAANVLNGPTDHLFVLTCVTQRVSPYEELHILRDLGPVYFKQEVIPDESDDSESSDAG